MDPDGENAGLHCISDEDRFEVLPLVRGLAATGFADMIDNNLPLPPLLRIVTNLLNNCTAFQPAHGG